MKLKLQLFITFAVLAVIIIAIAMIGFLNSLIVFDNFNSISEETAPELALLGELRSLFHSLELNLQEQIFYNSLNATDSTSAIINEKAVQFTVLNNALEEKLLEIMSDETFDVDFENTKDFESESIMQIYELKSDLVKNSMMLINSQKENSAESHLILLQSDIERLSNTIHFLIDDRIESELEELERKDVIAEEISSQILNQVIFVIIFCSLIATILSFLFTKSILNPFSKLQLELPNISKGNFKELKLEGPDEIRDLIYEFNNMVEQLKELDKMKDNLSAVVSHELRTPLVPIIGNLEILLLNKSHNLTSDQKIRIQKIKEKCLYMKILISSIMDLTKLNEGIFKITKQRISLIDTIHEALENFELILSKKNIKLEIVSSDFKINGDRLRLVQVFANLISNSIDFCSKVANPKITISMIQENNYVRITIHDNGKGLARKDLHRIFKSFYQVDGSHTREHEGTGIGLTVCRGIIHSHGGRIWARSKGIGQGTDIILLLPIS